MQRTQVDSEHSSERYLADQMSPQEAAEFEKLCLEHPEVYRDIEATLRLKEGLAVLQERGELERLLRVRPRRQFIKAAAAVVLLSLLGWWAWKHHERSHFAQDAVASAAVSTSRPSLPIAASVVLVRSRGPATVTSLALPSQASAIELKVLPSMFVEHGRYTVTLAQQREGALDAVGRAEVVVGGDRYLTVYVNSALLGRGQYELTAVIESQAAGLAGQDRFVIHFE